MMNNNRTYMKAIAAVSFFLLCTPVHTHAMNIEGRVFNEAGPLKGAQVFVYKEYMDINGAKPFMLSEATDKEGKYRMQVPPGAYYFTARGSEGKKNYFAYHGNNPIKVGEESVWLALMANEITAPKYSDGPTALKGRVTYKGKPVKDAFLALYTPETRSFKGLGFRTEAINADGTFNLAVPYGNYIVLAKKMVGDNKIRPLKKGDLFCYFPQNPVEVKMDKVVTIELSCYPKADRNSFSDAPRIKENGYTTVETIASKFESGIKGRVVDAGGKPVSDAYVLAYRGEPTTVFMMFHVAHGTEYATKTDRDGYYSIPIDSDGSFYLIARSTLGGSPHSGDLYGLYGGNPWHFVRFLKGQTIDSINIVVGTAMDEKAKLRDKPATRVKDATYQTDFILDEDTVWEGNIVINGTVWIKRGVTLFVDPGAVVKFKKLDRDKNDVGDGEIVVEGRIVARGTKDKRILFTSAEEKPEANDWSYVLFLATGTDSVLEYCEFQYAFSALQIHYSNATVVDCVFKNNNEGVRFNRSNVVIEHNDFLDNDIGVRFVRLQGKAIVRQNRITGNNVGVLFMQPHGKTVNYFFDETKPGVEQPLIVDNNIHDNNNYNFKVGQRQSPNLDVRGNWWGKVGRKELEEFIFDKKNDDDMGQVIYSPELRERVLHAGARNADR